MSAEKVERLLNELCRYGAYASEEEAYIVAFVIHGSGGSEVLQKDYVRFTIARMTGNVPVPGYLLDAHQLQGEFATAR